jgi:hypothetical protein
VAGTSSLKDLFLEFCVDTILDDSDLLRVPQALEKLTCSFLYSANLLPNGYIAALRPLYSTLVFLELMLFEAMNDVTGPVADFSYLVCLKTLIVDDGLCYEAWSSDRPDRRSGFYNRLPSTLEILLVSVMDVFCLLGYESC